jgi:uncharacterized membrane protein YkoI
MNTSRLRSKRVVIPTVATVAALGIGGVVWTTTANADIRGTERERVVEAVSRTVDGTVVDVEAGDDPGVAYEVEVLQADGTEVDLVLDQDLQVLSRETDRDDDGDERDDDDRDDVAGDLPDADDRALSAAERTAAGDAALAAVDGATVVDDVDASDDGDVAYEVEVRTADGTEWDVDLAADLRVLRTSVED